MDRGDNEQSRLKRVLYLYMCVCVYDEQLLVQVSLWI